MAQHITGFETSEGVKQYDYNALANLPAGVTDATNTVISPNADYAEVGEWADGNPTGEDRLGYFVSIAAVGDNTIKIRKATSADDVRGVSVYNPAFSGNASKDKYGEDGDLLPRYNYIGVMGIVKVIDNGLCSVNGRCMPGDDGTAIPSDNNMGYAVLERVDEDHVLIAVEPGADMIQRVKKDVENIENQLENGVGVHIGDEAPENGEQLWVDTNEFITPDGDTIVIDPPDWNANEGEAGHVLNRTHYVDEKGIIHKLPNKFIDAEWMATSVKHVDNNIVIPEQSVTSIWNNRQMDIQPGIIYDVHINGVVYPCEAFNEDGICLGNNTSLKKNDLPFCIYWAGGTATSGFFYKNSSVLSGTIYMKVTGHSYEKYNKLPRSFLTDGVVMSVNGEKPDEKGNVEVVGSFCVNISAVDGYSCSTPVSTLEAVLGTYRLIAAKITTDTGVLFAQLCSYETSANNSYGKIVMFALGVLTFTLTPTASGIYDVAVSGD